MSMKLVSTISELTASQKTAIGNQCKKLDIVPVFFNNASDATEAATEADILFTSSAALVGVAKHLKWVCTPSAGINQFVGEGIFPDKNTILTNSSGAYGTTISEHVIMMILEILRRQPEYNTIVSERKWIRDLPIRSIYGSRVTLLGTGDIGRNIARRISAFSPKCVIGINRSGRVPDPVFESVYKISDLSTLLPETDILICSLPGTPETEHLLSADRLAMLPDSAVIINVGRGSLIDQGALEKELRNGRLFAGLDVFETEPIPRDNSIWECPNLLITPHSAGNMSLPHTIDVIVDMFLKDLTNFAECKPLANQVNIRVGY